MCKKLNPRVSQRHPLIKFHSRRTTKNKYNGTPLIRSPLGQKKNGRIIGAGSNFITWGPEWQIQRTAHSHFLDNCSHKVIFSYINCLEFTFSVIMWRPLYQTDGTVVPKYFQFRPSLVAVCWTFYRKISRIQQCREPRGLQLWFYSATWRASSRETKTNLQMRIHACKRLPR